MSTRALPSMLDQLRSHAAESGWDFESFRTFRMEEGGGEGGTGQGEGGSGGESGGQGGAEGGAGNQGGQQGGGSGGTRSLEELLAALPESDRSVLLGEVGKARSEAKNLRERMKALEPKASEYDKLVEASKTETERAQEAARQAEARVQSMREQIAAAEIKAALAGVVPDPAAVVADLNVSKFLTESGEIDTAALTALRERYSALAPTGTRAPAPHAGQGANNRPREGQITREQFVGMSAEQIVEAQSKGLLDDVLGIKK